MKKLFFIIVLVALTAAGAKAAGGLLEKTASAEPNGAASDSEERPVTVLIKETPAGPSQESGRNWRIEKVRVNAKPSTTQVRGRILRDGADPTPHERTPRGR